MGTDGHDNASDPKARRRAASHQGRGVLPVVLTTALPAIITIALGALVVLEVALPAYRKSLLAAKREMVRELTASVVRLLYDYDERVQSGELTEREAKDRAKERLRVMRYGPEGKDYFWINDVSDRITMVMHPHRPDLEGKDVTDTPDERGFPMFEEFRRVAVEAGGGYVAYHWQWKDDPGKIVPKISHVRLFEPWNWVIGTGMYVEDVRAEIAALTREMARIFGGILALILAMTGFLTWQNIRTEERRLRAAVELSQSEQRLEMALEGAALGTWSWDVRTGEVDYDRRWAHMLGYEPGEIELTFAGWERLTHPDDLPAAKQRLEAHLAGQTDYFEIEHRLRSKSGAYVWVLSKGRITDRDADGEPIRACGTHLDISQRKRAEAEQEKLQAQLRQSQKMEAVGQLAGGVAHDFNNILQAILGYGEIALVDTRDNPAAKTSIEEILKAGRRAKTLVSQMLAFSRRQVLEMERLDLNEVVADLVKMIQRLIGEHIALQVQAGKALDAVRADRGQIAQILTNLCVNARDAMADGGSVTIATDNVDLTPEFCASHAWAQPGRYVLLSVADTGCGMDRETQRRIFEPFFTTKGVGKGTGLGLSTVYGLVEQHRGHIEVYSEPGQGSIFKIYLPAVGRPAAETAEAGEETSPTGNETILVAEDDENILSLSKSILEHAGYTVLCARDGDEAVRVFQEHKEHVDLAVLDVVMPQLSGRAAFERMKAVRPELPVLFASGYSADAVHTDFILDAGLLLLKKPFGGDELLRKVRDALDGA